MICILIVLTPAITGFIMITVFFKDIALVQMLAPLTIVAYSVLINFLIMLFGKKIFENVELI